METAICFSQYFVDKQNVRSYSNILKLKSLENNEKFLRHVFKEDAEEASELSKDLLQILFALNSNLKHKWKQDFSNYFNRKENPVLHPLNKDIVYNNCWRALNDVIPRSLYGCNHNERIFQKLVQSIIYCMRRQHILFGKHVRKWNFSVYPWLTVGDDKSVRVLHHVLLWIIQYILSPIICLNFYVTTCKLDADEYKLYFFWKNQWQSFYDRKVIEMTRQNVLKRFEPYCSGKKVKRNHSFNLKKKLKLLKKDIPKLHLILKSNNDYRPIVRYKNNAASTAEKYKIKSRLSFLKALAGKNKRNTENQFATLYQEWIKLQKPKLYFVKTDLSNAFGSIDRSALGKVLDDQFKKYLHKQKCERTKDKQIQQYKDVISELRKPIFVRAGSTVFVWRKGLVQGYKYSPALSELYYSYMDEIYFSKHLKDVENGLRLFTRAVDDYLFITDSLTDAYTFLDALKNYKNVNYRKTVVNFPHSDIKCSDQITFLGYTYDTSTLHVSRASSIYTGQMCYKIAFTQAIADVHAFLEQRIGQSSIKINGHLFNLHRNTEEAVWSHIFTTLCLSANKFCTILAILCEAKEMKAYLEIYKKRITVRLCNSIIDTLVKNKPPEIVFLYCINHFRYLSWKALMLCAQATPKCNQIVSYIADELAKSNCIFGKWREHACRIKSNGELGRQAVKEVCRRSDWRAIMNKHVALPDGFQCYHHKKVIATEQ